MNIKETKRLARELVKNQIAIEQLEKRNREIKDIFLKEGLDGISAQVGDVLGMIYYCDQSVSRIWDKNKLTDYLGDKVEEFKQDRVNKEHYAIKLVNSKVGE